MPPRRRLAALDSIGRIALEFRGELTVLSIFEYMDYRKLLHDAFEERQALAPGFTYKVLAEELGLDTSYVYRILHNRSHLPVRCQTRAIEFLKLTDRAAEYFVLLVAYARERNSSARQELLENALSLRDVQRRILQEIELTYFGSWWVGAVRSMIAVMAGRCDAAEISRRLQPTVPVEQVAEAIDLLQTLGFLKKATSGRLIPTEAHVAAGTSPAKIEVIRKYQKDVLELAAGSIERFPPSQRDISTITLSVDAAAFGETMGMLKECRRRIQKRAEETTKPDRVIQLAMAAFPLSTSLEAPT